VTRTRLVWTLAGATVLTQVAYPLTSGPVRDRLTVGTVLLFFATSVAHALVTRGPRTAAVLVAVTAGGGLLVESVGTATGYPFGSYTYGDSLGATVLGVPAVIPLAWTMMAWPAWLVATRLVRHTLARVAVAGWALASWDVFLDPQMVAAGHWSWAGGDIPLTNYAAWLGVAVLMMSLLPRVTVHDGHDGHDAAMYALYLWTYASSVLAHAVFLGLPASAAWGALAMGPVAVPLAVSLWRARR
jgi:putative membrane protein